MLAVGAVGCASVFVALCIGISGVTVNICLRDTLSQNKLMQKKNKSQRRGLHMQMNPRELKATYFICANDKKHLNDLEPQSM